MVGEAEKPKDIRERCVQYALRAIKLYQALDAGKDGAGRIIGKQFLRSATSVGANMEEAQASESRPDFVHKCGIAQKEATESRYWLRLLAEADITPRGELQPLIQETNEIYAVITAIIVNAKKRL